MNNKTTRMLLLSALALTGMLMACNREDPVVNPDYDPDSDSVHTQFVMSVSTGQTSPTTKMSADAVQKNNNFFGITDAKLFAYKTGLTAVAPYVNNSAGTGFAKSFDLGTLYSNGDINASQNLEKSSNRILQLTIPVGTDAMIFYGKAINAQPGKVVVEEAAGGKGAGLLPDVAAAGGHDPVLTVGSELGQVFAQLILVQPLLPAVGVVNLCQQGFAHSREDGNLAFLFQALLHFFKFAEGAIFAHRELGADVCGAHTAERVLLGVCYIIGVVTFDVASQRTDFGCETTGHFAIEDGGVQVGTNLSDYETRPDVSQSFTNQP